MESAEELTGVGKLGIRYGERRANDEWRMKEIGDGSGPFGDEKALSFTRLSALKISRYREHAHWAGMG